MHDKLFAVYLGGRAPKCNTELHDVVFVVGPSIEATYEQLLGKWFGDLRGLHLDSWMELRIVDGYRIGLRPTPTPQSQKLYFVNLGAYVAGRFTEVHGMAFMVAKSEKAVKARAKDQLLRGMEPVHTDDLRDLDDCLRLDAVEGRYVHLEATTEVQAFEPVNGYHVVPKALVRAYEKRSRAV